MGQQIKYHIADNGDIFNINEDGSFSTIGNVSQIAETNNPQKQTQPTIKKWLTSNYNWLYLISLTGLVVSGMWCICTHEYYSSGFYGMLSLCIGITAIATPWIFKTISKVWVILLFLLLISAHVTIITLSNEWNAIFQIAFAFISLFTFAIAYAKNVKPRNK